MFLRKDHPKFMKKRQTANPNKMIRKHEKNIKEIRYDIVDKKSRALDVLKSRFNKEITNHEMAMVATNVILYTLCLSKF